MLYSFQHTMDHARGVLRTAFNLDANETLFFARQLEEIESTMYMYDVPDLQYRKYIPVASNINPGALSATYHMTEMVGEAQIGNGAYAGDMPRADARSTEHTQAIKPVTSSFGWNVQELRSAAMANIPLDRVKSDSAIRAIREGENRVAWKGDATSGLLGLLNNPNIQVLVAAKTWATATAAEILADCVLMYNTVVENSKGTRKPNTFLLPMAQFLRLSSTVLGDNADKTILQFLRENLKELGIDTIDFLPTELKNAFNSGTEDGAIMYSRNPAVVEQRIPLEVVIHPVQIKGFEFIFPVESRHGGTIVRYPHGCVILRGF